MAQLTVQVRDAHLPRVLEAFGKNGTAAAQADVEEELQDYCRQRVKKYETIRAADAKRSEIEKETW